MLFLEGLTLVVLLAITIQDFKFRAVYWWLFPILLICLGIGKNMAEGSTVLVHDLFYNVVFLSMQFLFLLIYFSVKERRMVNILKGYLGLGDVLFLVCLAVYFSFLNYLFFYLVSLFVILLFGFMVKGHRNKNDNKIPMAGYQAALLICWGLFDQFSSTISLISDNWLIDYFKL